MFITSTVAKRRGRASQKLSNESQIVRVKHAQHLEVGLSAIYMGGIFTRNLVFVHVDPAEAFQIA